MIKERDSLLSNTVHKQKGGTCYAHAAATVLASAEKRIVGRIIKDHERIVDEITRKHGFNGGDCAQVLADECCKRGLRFEMIEKIEEAQYYIQRRHALLATFDLQENQWTNLSQFIKSKPGGILTMDDLNRFDAYSNETSQSDIDSDENDESKVYAGDLDKEKEGHAVAISDYNEKEKYWIIKNSWGEESGDGGYWRVSAHNGLDLTFYHVYFLLEDLTDIDIANYMIRYGTNAEIELELYRRGEARASQVKFYANNHPYIYVYPIVMNPFPNSLY